MFRYTILFYILSFVIYEVKSDSLWSDFNDKEIKDINEHCKNKNCIVKCCNDDEIMTASGCIPTEGSKKMDYSKVVFKDGGYQLSNSSKDGDPGKSFQNATFVKNSVLSNPNVTAIFFTCNITILENDSLKVNDPECVEAQRLEYCIGFYRLRTKNTSARPVSNLVLAYRMTFDVNEDSDIKHYYVAIGFLISSFFMFLVLLVYILLPRLQNIVGLSLMGYLSSLSIMFILKSWQYIALAQSTIDTDACLTSSPAIYFFTLGSFFWLNIMSFDLWWTVRGTRKQRRIHRQGQLMKFMWYVLYAWGTPALLTVLIVAVERNHWYTSFFKPPFSSCYANWWSTIIYMHVPIAAMTIANCVLFFMTIYNIWLVRKGINNSKDSSNTKESENRFAIYIKLFVIMGVSWLLEFTPELPLILELIVNFCNVFIGIPIFIILVCKRSILVMLCVRFNIRNRFVDRFQHQTSRSESTKTSSMRKSHNDKKHDEAAELTTFTVTET